MFRKNRIITVISIILGLVFLYYGISFICTMVKGYSQPYLISKLGRFNFMGYTMLASIDGLVCLVIILFFCFLFTGLKGNLSFLLPVRSVMFLAVFFMLSVVLKKDLKEISNWWSVIATLVNVITLVILIMFQKKQGRTYRELINLEKGKTKGRQIVLMTLLIVFVGMAGMYLAGFICYGVIPYAAPMLIAPIPLWLAVINLFLLPVSTALAEDGLYLGAGVNGIKNKYSAILVPAFFFALQHSFIPVLFDMKYIIYRFLSFLPLTIILSWKYYKEKNPLPIMIGHGIIDVFTVLQILATSAIPGFYDMMCGM